MDKKLRKLRKALRQTPPGKIDLIQWLKLHGYAQTAGEARRLILAGRIKSESHVMGIGKGFKLDPMGQAVEYPIVDPLVPASVRSTLHVTTD